jgi:hypothetical protein
MISECNQVTKMRQGKRALEEYKEENKMFAREARMQPFWMRKDMKVSDEVREENNSEQSERASWWYVAGKALPQLKYVLTTTGYVVLP